MGNLLATTTSEANGRFCADQLPADTVFMIVSVEGETPQGQECQGIDVASTGDAAQCGGDCNRTGAIRCFR